MKTRIFNSSAVVIALGLAGLAFAGPRNPSGEKAAYGLDKDSARTSGMVQSGSLNATVGQHVDDTDGPSYNVAIDYNFNVILVGNKVGTENVGVPDAYFTPEFMAQLRKDGHYESPKFKVDYLGTEDAATMDGHSYPGCDKIKIYDIKQPAGAVVNIARAMLGASPDAQIDNLVIVAAIYQGVPVLGAVKLDVSGTYSGMNIKAGADYNAP